MKLVASRGMSSGRSRKGGRMIGYTFSLKNRSFLKASFLISSFRFLWVAAKSLTSTLKSLWPPTLSSVCSWITRNIFAWVFRLISPISSRNKVLLSASSNFPFFMAEAPVKAPFSCPNSSLSTRSSGMAALLRTISGFPARWDRWWMALATNSLPVPVSPTIRTGSFVDATFWMRWYTFFILLEQPRRAGYSWNMSRDEMISSEILLNIFTASLSRIILRLSVWYCLFNLLKTVV